MGHETDHDRDIRALLGEAHRPPAPPFERLWSAARERARPGARVRRRALLGGAAALAAVLLWAVVGLRDPRPSGPIPEVLLTGVRWSGPLDFLLETPGSDLLRATPSFSTAAPAVLERHEATDLPYPTTRRSDHET